MSMMRHVFLGKAEFLVAKSIAEGLAQIAGALIERNKIERDRLLVEQSRLTANQHDWCRKQKEEE